MKPHEHDIMRAVEDHYWWYQALRQHVVDSIEPGGGTFSVLDAGCGSGGMLAALREKFLQAELTGIDESEHALDCAVEVDRRYTRAQVRAILRGENFEIERLTYWNAVFAPPIALLRWLSRRRPASEEARSDFRPLPSFANSVLKGFAALELRATRHLS